MAHHLSRGTSGETLQAVSLSWSVVPCLKERLSSWGGDLGPQKQWEVEGVVALLFIRVCHHRHMEQWLIGQPGCIRQFPDFTFVSCYGAEALGDGNWRREKRWWGEQDKVSVSWLLQTLGSAPPGHAQAVLLSPGRVTQATPPLIHPKHLGHTLGTPNSSAQLLQEGVSGLMFCNAQGVEKSISSNFFFKLHIISTPLPWTFAIEIEAHLDLVFWFKTRGKWKWFLMLLCCTADLQMGMPHPLRPRGQGKGIEGLSCERQELGWNTNVKWPRDEKAPKRTFCLWGHMKRWTLSSFFIQEPQVETESSHCDELVGLTCSVRQICALGFAPWWCGHEERGQCKGLFEPSLLN